ncbi:MAG: GtrA family protein [SAR202 cluster bacterium]|nr:GtrA family protein [SAR202 cluster bacterium]
MITNAGPLHKSVLGGEIARYLVAGGTAWLLDVTLLYLLTEFVGLHYLLSAAISFTVGVAITYVLSTIWVFKARAMQNRGAELAVFGTIGVVGLGLNELFLWFFTDPIAMHYMVGKVFSTVFVLAWNFAARKYMLFR